MKKSDKMRELLKSLESKKESIIEEIKKAEKEEEKEKAFEKEIREMAEGIIDVDVNKDGKIDQKDVEAVKKSIRKKKKR